MSNYLLGHIPHWLKQQRRANGLVGGRRADDCSGEMRAETTENRSLWFSQSLSEFSPLFFLLSAAFYWTIFADDLQGCESIGATQIKKLMLFLSYS